MKSERRHYTKEFKIEAVELAYRGDKKVSEVAIELGITPKILYRWKKEMAAAGAFAFRGSGKEKVTSQAELEAIALRKEIAILKEERAILKKVLAIFSKEQR